MKITEKQIDLFGKSFIWQKAVFANQKQRKNSMFRLAKMAPLKGEELALPIRRGSTLRPHLGGGHIRQTRIEK